MFKHTMYYIECVAKLISFGAKDGHLQTHLNLIYFSLYLYTLDFVYFCNNYIHS